MMQGSIYGSTKIDAESVTDHSPGQRPGTAVSSIHHPEAMGIITVPDVIEGLEDIIVSGETGR